tara:strand:- start:122 stop:487 length:366 start_codon:yes stop_codon:yes gene_type:complete
MPDFNHRALALKGGKVIATGYNGYKGRKFSRSFCTTHAEVNCIQNINCKERKRRDIVICSIFEGEYFKNSKPCFNCCQSLSEFGIRRIRYFDGESWIEENVTDVMKTAIVSSGDRPRKLLS